MSVAMIESGPASVPEAPEAAGRWFVFHAGELAPAAEPGWMAAGEGAAGFVHVEEGRDHGCFAFEVHEHRERPHWLFFFGWNRVYTVEVRGFADYLAFLARVAPIATTGLLSRLCYTAEEEARRSRR